MTVDSVPLASAILIWSRDNCPSVIIEYMRAVSISDSDVDWIALVPEIYNDVWISFLDAPHFGCSDVVVHKIPKRKYSIVVGYHS